ncbi:sporulation protein [Paenactinomyces guangxiensis]|uniref:Sporulation protein n=1 Tax=Paenactinomyces guangxiensis TaxID=1490290 RepID=A0A7W1WSU5_9BACL|nr:sporulation protein [Paenactinomyces guangxiensis]MBA4495428.1 sporulation protein [Paenactinomyces guangxiensis]MBH8592451.1 sporulation protein [Paenactinomyces guangxiensis]
MSVFEKALASLGIGSAKVDTRLEKATYRQGETIRGEVFIQGGQADQFIDEIYLFLVVQYHHEGTQDEYVVSEFRLTDAFDITPRETKVIPFQFQLPYDTPITTGGSPVYLKTGLDIKMAVDPADTDGIEVLPHPLVDTVLHTVEEIGFQLYGVEYEFGKFYSRHPFVQEYKFKPVGRFAEWIDELEVVFFPRANEVDGILSIDLKAVDLMSSMEEALELDERMVRFTVSSKEVEKGTGPLKAKLERIIKQHM